MTEEQNQIVQRCQEYKQALEEALKNAEETLDNENFIDTCIDYNRMYSNKKYSSAVETYANTRETAREQLLYVIKKIKYQLELLPEVQDWLVFNYKLAIDMDIALGNILNLDCTQTILKNLRDNIN